MAIVDVNRCKVAGALAQQPQGAALLANFYQSVLATSGLSGERAYGNAVLDAVTNRFDRQADELLEGALGSRWRDQVLAAPTAGLTLV